MGNDNSWEKWLRRRLDYSVVRETGRHAPPALVHALVHGGDSPSDVVSQLNHELWANNNLPDTRYFNHGEVAYSYPREVRETITLRFANEPYVKPKPPCMTTCSPTSPAHHVTLRQLATAPRWYSPVAVDACPLPHALEAPMSWPMEEPRGPNTSCQDYQWVHKPVFPEGCSDECGRLAPAYCRAPLPPSVYGPGPHGRGTTVTKWAGGSFRENYY